MKSILFILLLATFSIIHATQPDSQPEQPHTYEPEPPHTYEPEPPHTYEPEPPHTYEPEPPHTYEPEPPHAYQPETHQSDTHQPETHQPETHQPETHQPEMHQPETHEPEMEYHDEDNHDGGDHIFGQLSDDDLRAQRKIREKANTTDEIEKKYPGVKFDRKNFTTVMREYSGVTKITIITTITCNESLTDQKKNDVCNSLIETFKTCYNETATPKHTWNCLWNLVNTKRAVQGQSGTVSVVGTTDNSTNTTTPTDTPTSMMPVSSPTTPTDTPTSMMPVSSPTTPTSATLPSPSAATPKSTPTPPRSGAAKVVASVLALVLSFVLAMS